jgi:hypothetical protein
MAFWMTAAAGNYVLFRWLDLMNLPVVGLLDAPVVVIPPVTLADVSEASWPGYARQPITGIVDGGYDTTVSEEIATCNTLTFSNTSGGIVLAHAIILIGPPNNLVWVWEEPPLPLPVPPGGTLSFDYSLLAFFSG